MDRPEKWAVFFCCPKELNLIIGLLFGNERSIYQVCSKECSKELLTLKTIILNEDDQRESGMVSRGI